MKRFITSKNIFVGICLLIIFFFALRVPLDPDMGWHLRDGQIFLQNRSLPATDPYSYTMPDFPVIAHEWLTDIGMYFVYHNFGLLALSIIFALIAALAFFLVSLSVKAKTEYQVTAALLGVIASIPILGVRPQILTLLGLAAVIYIIYHFARNPQTKLVYILPLIFLFWVNLHGGFLIGFFALGLFLGLEMVKIIYNRVKKRKIGSGTLQFNSWFQLFYITLFSFAVTFINPYGYRIYIEIINTITDVYAQSVIGEWLPVFYQSPASFQFIIYLVLLAILAIFYWRKFNFTQIGMALAFLYISFSSWRNMPFFMIISIPLLVTIVQELSGKAFLDLVRKKWLLIFLAFAMIIVGKQQVEGILPPTDSLVELAKRSSHPYQAVEFLKENPQEGNMFNEYNWGGYLIWQLPEQKVFIDGRMAIWRMGEQHILKEFRQINSASPGWKEILAKYDVNWAFISSDGVLQNFLILEGWKEIYRDDTAVILKRS